MAERTFLEEVGNLYSINALGTARAWEIRHLRNDSTLPPVMYVIESDAGRQFLLGREVSGRPKFNTIRTIAKLFIECFFEQLKGKELTQYLILRGAYPFDLQYAFGYTSSYDRLLLPTGFIKLQRVLNQKGDNWEIHAQDLIGEYQGDIWLLPDTALASGSTIAHFLRNGFLHHLPRQVYVITACGSLEGIQRIYQECLKKNVDLIPVFSQCIFEVSKVGNLPGLPLTDLSIISPGSVTTKKTYEEALRRYQGTRLCCVGDIGESLENPIEYSIHTLQEMKLVGMDPAKEDWSAWTVDVRTEEIKKKVRDFNPSLADYFREIWK
jgi:uracil phosphoribosyltransferase